MVVDASGNLYGSTLEGGNDSACNAGGGCGVIFELSPESQENVLHYFTGGKDGYSPVAGVTLDDAGTIYGTALAGGDPRCNPPLGCGTVFKITP